MSTLVRRSIWFSRIVLAIATLLFIMISGKYALDPVGAVAPHGITLGSPEAVTMMRVSGGVFLGIAITLVACQLAAERLLVGLYLLATVATAILALRLVGLGLDGPAPFTVHVLKPEVAIVTLALVAMSLERKRRRTSIANTTAPVREVHAHGR